MELCQPIFGVRLGGANTSYQKMFGPLEGTEGRNYSYSTSYQNSSDNSALAKLLFANSEGKELQCLFLRKCTRSLKSYHYFCPDFMVTKLWPTFESKTCDARLPLNQALTYFLKNKSVKARILQNFRLRTTCILYT